MPAIPLSKKASFFYNTLFGLPNREYFLIIAVCFSLVTGKIFPQTVSALFAVSVIGGLPTLWFGLKSVFKKKISIDTFNTVALIIAFVTGEILSAAFIVLMLTFARLLDWHTESRTENAVEELIKLKPLTAFVEEDGEITEIPVDRVNLGDVLVVKNGSRAPVDGIIIFGEASVNEASVNGESRLIEKAAGDSLWAGTMVESGVLKIKATRVGKDSTIERMASLMREAAKHKSRSEKLADRFAQIFLPVVALIGLMTYWFSRDITMVAAIFLVACADDMAVAIPLAMTASLGKAAKRGVLIKGGEWLEVLRQSKILVLDKTGTLTYGELSIEHVSIGTGTDEKEFWSLVGGAEKFSEHPIARAVFHEASRHSKNIPDPDTFEMIPEGGVRAKVNGRKVVLGNAKVARELGIDDLIGEDHSLLFVFFDDKPMGKISLADFPRSEAKTSLEKLSKLGFSRIIMLTGDNQKTAEKISKALGIREFYAGVTPEEKLRKLEELLPQGKLAMVGDGVNDAPALARSDVGIAMGGGGTAVAVQAAQVVILTDDLSRLPEMVELSRKTFSVIKSDMVIWLLSNLVGFALVLTGFAGPAAAAFYNFATDFFPLINSARLFRKF